MTDTTLSRVKRIPQLTMDSKVRVHEHRVRQQESVLKKEVEGLAVIDLHMTQQRLLQRVAELQLDPTEEALVIAKIVAACMGKAKENRRENHHDNT